LYFFNLKKTFVHPFKKVHYFPPMLFKANGKFKILEFGSGTDVFVKIYDSVPKMQKKRSSIWDSNLWTERKPLLYFL